MNRNLAAAAVLCLALAGCGQIKEKAAGFYLKKAESAAASPALAENEMVRAFGWLGKALELDPSSGRALRAVGALSAAASRGGHARASELEAGVLQGLVKRDPLQWRAYPPLVHSLALRGELESMAALAASLARLEKELSGRDRYHALMAACLARAALLPWLGSDGFLALGRNPERVRERAMEYASQAELLVAARSGLAALEKAEPAVRAGASQELLAAFEVAMGDVFGRPEGLERARGTAARLSSDPPYARAVELTVKGNVHLIAREYREARAMYTSALKTLPGFIDARRQLAEVDFQEGAGLAATGSGLKQARQLLYRAYDETEDLIEAALEKGPAMPFTARDRFAGELYALKAAVISAVRAIEGARLRNRAKLENEFRAALDEAVRLAPESRLARELLERYSKEGF